MKHDLPEELREAVELLESAERKTDLVAHSRDFREAFEKINGYLEGEPESRHAAYLSNVKFAHTRILLRRLKGAFDSLDIGTWVMASLTLTEASKELGSITSEDAELERFYERFRGLWREEVKELLDKISLKYKPS